MRHSLVSTNSDFDDLVREHDHDVCPFFVMHTETKNPSATTSIRMIPSQEVIVFNIHYLQTHPIMY